MTNKNMESVAAVNTGSEMKNETGIVYDAGTETTETTPATMLTDAKIRLAGHVEPAVSIRNRRELEKFCVELISGSAVEEFHIICVNAQCQVVSESMVSRGSLSEVSCYPRTVATVALLSNAHGVFITHNHPGGTCYPSGADVNSTIEIKKALSLFGIYLLDHMIVTPGGGSYSMASNGDITR